MSVTIIEGSIKPRCLQISTDHISNSLVSKKKRLEYFIDQLISHYMRVNSPNYRLLLVGVTSTPKLRNALSFSSSSLIFSYKTIGFTCVPITPLVSFITNYRIIPIYSKRRAIPPAVSRSSFRFR